MGNTICKSIKKPIFDCWLFKMFDIETKRYKQYWKKYSLAMQIALESQPKNLHYTKLLS